MKPYCLARYLLLLVTLSMLLVSTNSAALQLPSDGLSRHADSHASMMMVGTTCDGCPKGTMPLDQGVQCTQSLPWLPVALTVPFVRPFEQPPYLSLQPLLAWAQYPSLPWKPPRRAMLNA